MSDKTLSNLFFIKTLVNKVSKEDNTHAFKQLFYLFNSNLIKTAYYYLKSEVEAEEVVLEVFTTIWEKRKTLLKVKNISSFLFISVKNKCLKRLEKLRKEQKEKNDFLYTANVDSNTNTMTALSTNDNTTELKTIKSIIQNLPTKCQIIFVLVKIHGMRHKAVAQKLCISTKTVESHIRLALQKIHAKLSTSSIHPKKNIL